MKTKRLAFLLITLLCALFILSVPLDNASAAVLQTVDWSVIAGGGGHAESGIYTLDGTIGQPVVGAASATTNEICSGFWSGISTFAKLYLPLIMR